MTEWLGNCQEKFYQFTGRKVKSMGQREIQRAEDRGRRSEVRDQRTEGSRQVAAGSKQAG
jgi:hypothetical protein